MYCKCVGVGRVVDMGVGVGVGAIAQEVMQAPERWEDEEKGVAEVQAPDGLEELEFMAHHRDTDPEHWKAVHQLRSD